MSIVAVLVVTETPINGNGEGVPLTWATEPFRIVP
jgi:hypothetical protein